MTNEAHPDLEPRRRSVRRDLATGLYAVQVVLTLAAPIAACVQTESIIATGPAASIFGLGLAVVTRPLRSWAVTLFGISASLMSALCAALIAMFDWGPEVARAPVITILATYTLLVIPLAVKAWRQLWNWQPDESSQRPLVLRYSLKSMLWATSALCVLLVVVRLAVDYVKISAPFGFGLYALISVAIIGIVTVYFMADMTQ